MEITEADAKLIQRALIAYNSELLSEGAKIWDDPDVSQFLKEAASRQYNEATEEFSKFHVRLVEAFPVLTQR